MAKAIRPRGAALARADTACAGLRTALEAAGALGRCTTPEVCDLLHEVRRAEWALAALLDELRTPPCADHAGS